jgi:hypothetical protein
MAIVHVEEVSVLKSFDPGNTTYSLAVVEVSK